MNCPIVCRQFFNQVNFLAGVYIYLKNFFFFFFFFLQTHEYLFKASSKYKLNSFSTCSLCIPLVFSDVKL